MSGRFQTRGFQIHSKCVKTKDIVGSFFKCINLGKYCIYDQQIIFFNTVIFLLLSKKLHICEHNEIEITIIKDSFLKVCLNITN